MNYRPARGSRVLVQRCSDTEVPLGGVPGVIYRPRRADDGAWVRLDARSEVIGAHPFPAEDERGRDVLAFPPDYEVLS